MFCLQASFIVIALKVMKTLYGPLNQNLSTNLSIKIELNTTVSDWFLDRGSHNAAVPLTYVRHNQGFFIWLAAKSSRTGNYTTQAKIPAVSCSAKNFNSFPTLTFFVIKMLTEFIISVESVARTQVLSLIGILYLPLTLLQIGILLCHG